MFLLLWNTISNFEIVFVIFFSTISNFGIVVVTISILGIVLTSFLNNSKQNNFNMVREARRRKIPTISKLELCQLQFQIWELWINWSGTIPIWNSYGFA